MKYLERIGADQISFRKVGHSIDSHLNIQIEELNNFNQSGYVVVTQKQLGSFDQKELIDGVVFESLENNYNYAMNDKSPYYEECCPNCGAQAGEYEVTCMGGTPDRNKRTCNRCQATWYGYERTAELVTQYIKAYSEKKDDMKT